MVGGVPLLRVGMTSIAGRAMVGGVPLLRVGMTSIAGRAMVGGVPLLRVGMTSIAGRAMVGGAASPPHQPPQSCTSFRREAEKTHKTQTAVKQYIAKDVISSFQPPHFRGG